MNKAALVASVSGSTGMTKKAVNDALDAILDAVASSLAKGDNVTLTGFGTFTVQSRAARTGRNPKTGAAVSVPAKKVARFKAGKELRERVK